MSFERFRDFVAGRDDEPPARMGRYELVREVGRGGSAVVYEAWDPELCRAVAIKVPSGRAAERLSREGIAVARLRHPNIVAVYEVGLGFIAMELVDGRTFAEALPAMSQDERLAVIETVARALAYAHQQGVVHRDLKPANVLLRADGGVVLTDFGLAKVLGSADLTLTGGMLGTPHYMAPEQVNGKSTGPATDVWALGVMLHEALTGARPFEGETVAQIFDAIRSGTPAPAPGPLGPVVARALDRDPGRRYASAAAVAEEIARFRAGRAVQTRPRSRRLRIIALVAVVVLAGAGGVSAWRRHGSAPSAGQLLAQRLAQLDADEAKASEALSRNPQDAEAWVARGQARQWRGDVIREHGRNPLPDYAAADADFARALALAPGWRPRIGLGMTAAQRAEFKMDNTIDPSSDLDVAEAHLRQATAHPSWRLWTATVRFLKAAWRARGGADVTAELTTADGEYTQALETPLSREERAFTFANRGRVRVRLGRFDEAEADFARSLDLAPDYVWCWRQRAEARLAAGDRETAERYLTTALTLDPRHVRAWQGRGDLRFARGDRAGAVADWQQALTLDPTLATVLTPKIARARDGR